VLRNHLWLYVYVTVSAVLCLPSHAVFADDIPGVANVNRAKINYMLNCQGCHGPSGAAAADDVVPAMQDFLGKFLAVDGGREFLVRVPGSANAALSDTALAEVLNWLLPFVSADQMPADFVPYSGEEVGILRSSPLQDVATERAKLVLQFPQDKP